MRASRYGTMLSRSGTENADSISVSNVETTGLELSRFNLDLAQGNLVASFYIFFARS